MNEVNLQDTESLEFVQTAFRYEFLHLTATQLIKLFSYLQLKYFLKLSLTAALTQGRGVLEKGPLHKQMRFDIAFSVSG